MKIARTKNAVRNIAFGFVLKVYQLICPFMMRTVMICYLGVEYLGLNSLFASVLSVLNLAELGVGSAMVYCMYKPIAEDNKAEICALMHLYKIYYRIIGAVVAMLGILCIPFLPNLISGTVPEHVNLYVLYLLNLMTTVLSYWLFAYKNCLLNAHQRVDVLSKVSLIISTIQYVVQFIAVCVVQNYYLYLVTALVCQVLSNFMTAAVVSRMYPAYRAEGRLDRDVVLRINQRIRDLFTAKIGGVIVNSADTIVISAYLGLTVLAVYQNYYYIIMALITTVGIVFSSCTAGIGNSLIVESKEKNYRDLKKFTLMIAWLGGVCTCSLLCLYQPFMRMWVGEEFLLEFGAVVCFCIYYFVYEINQLLNLYKDAAGIWHEDRFRPLVTALANLAMNLAMVRCLGLYGVLLSTVISTACIGMPWLIQNLFTVLFDRGQKKDYVEKLFWYSGVTAFACALTLNVCSLIQYNDLLTFVLRGAVCAVLPNVIFWQAYRRQEEFADCVELVIRIGKGIFYGHKKTDSA